jgi:hypothetical protein
MYDTSTWGQTGEVSLHCSINPMDAEADCCAFADRIQNYTLSGGELDVMCRHRYSIVRPSAVNGLHLGSQSKRATCVPLLRLTQGRIRIRIAIFVIFTAHPKRLRLSKSRTWLKHLGVVTPLYGIDCQTCLGRLAVSLFTRLIAILP